MLGIGRVKFHRNIRRAFDVDHAKLDILVLIPRLGLGCAAGKGLPRDLHAEIPNPIGATRAGEGPVITGRHLRDRPGDPVLPIVPVTDIQPGGIAVHADAVAMQFNRAGIENDLALLCHHARAGGRDWSGGFHGGVQFLQRKGLIPVSRQLADGGDVLGSDRIRFITPIVAGLRQHGRDPVIGKKFETGHLPWIGLAIIGARQTMQHDARDQLPIG